MGIETFPEIENFQKLPRQVIVKGGNSSFDAADGARLTGIVINNIGNAIRDLRACIVLFNDRSIPILNTSIAASPESLQQGEISSFTFHFKNHTAEISNYYLYATWKFDDRE